MGAPLSGYYQFPELDIEMPGQDHSLRKLYTIEGLSNPSMVYNWICPILLKEDCPYEALACIFSMYFKDTSGINTSEDYLNFGWAAPSLLRVRLVHHETSHQKDTFVSTFFCVFLSLKIVTIFCNLVLLNACKYFYSPRYFTACECLLSSIILDTQPLT